ncbi:DNA internalization-related competence protein ComEC/Rec2 [candidate division KSB1 bacterium]|nr:DNA internalization-related competence protein ComEC/Rec2 [candidate division KSB1 bacterium]
MNELIRWLSNKPALAAVLPFVAGIMAANYLRLPILVLFILFAILCIICRVCRLPDMCLLPMLFVTGFLHLRLETLERCGSIKEFADLPHVVAIEGVICGPVESSDRGMRAVVRTDSVWVLNRVYPAKGKCLLQLPVVNSHLDYGDRIVARGQLWLPPGERNPGEFNYQKYLAARNIHTTLRIISANHLLVLNAGEGNPFMRRALYPVRSFIISVIDASLSGQPAALLKALLVGARENLDDDLQEGFANVGVIHVLAVSGLHVGFVLAALTGFFRFVRIPDPWRSFLIMACLVFYALLTGMRASVCRAVILAILYLAGMLLQRRAHLLNLLAVAALIILACSPLELFEPGFQLSFTAVVSIIFLYGRLSALLNPLLLRMREKGQTVFIWIINLFSVSLAAQIGTLPLTLFYYNRLSLIAIFANIIVIPLIALVVAVGMIAVCASLVSGSCGAIFLTTASLLLNGLIIFVDNVQHLPFAWLSLPRPSAFHLLVYNSCVLLFVLWPHIRARKFFFFTIIFLLNSHVWMGVRRHDGLKVTFFDVGQGDATLFEFPNGKTMLVDAGGRTMTIDCGERIIYPYLVRHGTKKIDHLVLTHNHSDHVGGASYLMSQKCVGRLIKAAASADSELDAAIQDCAEHNGVPIKYVQAGDTLLIDENVLILVFHPTKRFTLHDDNLSDANNSSIVLKCIYFAHSVLMTGDAEKAAESSMLRYEDLLQSSLLKVAHHGSDTAGDRAFRRRVAADYGIVSVARFNKFGLPSESLLNDYEEEGTRILRTSRYGAIQFMIYPEKMVAL